MNELELLKKIARGDEEAYEQVLDTYTAYVAAVCLRVAGQQIEKEDIEELCADIFFKLWNQAGKIQIEEGALRYYLGAMAKNHTLNTLQRQGRQAVMAFQEEYISTEDNNPEEVVLQQEELNEVTEAIQQLDGIDGELFIRRYFYRDKVKDIAQVMAMNESTITTKLARGKKKLRALLGAKG